MLHCWHDVSVGNDAPSIVNVLIEIPTGSKVKYELDKETGLLKVDRILASSVMYPCNYGFIPRTYCEDGDPLDVLVISQATFTPFCLANAKVLGCMTMLDKGEADDKIIAVHADDPLYRSVEDVASLSPHLLAEIKEFFQQYKNLENKKVEVKDFVSKEHALLIVNQAIEDYKKKFAQR